MNRKLNNRVTFEKTREMLEEISVNGMDETNDREQGRITLGLLPLSDSVFTKPRRVSSSAPTRDATRRNASKFDE